MQLRILSYSLSKISSDQCSIAVNVVLLRKMTEQASKCFQCVIYSYISKDAKICIRESSQVTPFPICFTFLFPSRQFGLFVPFDKAVCTLDSILLSIVNTFASDNSVNKRRDCLV
ncbi:hypothetical protein CDL12_05487 [Handroanthus impetiginosus]|uniref:Uncharacterized protein n=1 Tax=Handroanthus impetiginosus TaxID=429701 RepID=A0A2G9HWD6_9LAMI|nr:hypothetical protein CDL12_05487 [Handroanthus impetiginosus]